ncbi:peptidoglycan-associated lipoprotein Pal [Phaeobacter gallaeciensis]|uniref:Peptidoglycan-associated lipoprotein n=2 Tax=Roseobacteraceae TaxID=2854170 RepID=A0A366XAK4_9RHOB|nr:MULTISPECIES: peptidoglycan-associated lipoprotein Pal [Roseobacteraceae]MBT3142683.1 peptidoglycan-associated lipoprotein Pal [Falsiruegeria litorea]MBT8168207.1 peptidoglycan-associated lipoprotein Pal [Falsiruegeria litorea]RBW61560.1 peptidoglycan-associated lipoprotein Pal [Phaeobacter gallaeciensis]
MNLVSKLIAGCALMALAACNNPTDGTDGGPIDPNAGTTSPGLIGDQTSPSYFQQAIGDRVLFTVDQSTINSEAQSILQAQANWLLANTDYNATIEGHADEQGTREYNLALGARRANAAREFLISKGIAGSRLKTVSYGKERPIEICSEESCYAKNRRAVTVLLGGLAG